MPLRIGFDLDGVLADFEGAYRAVEERLFGPSPGPTVVPTDPALGASAEEKIRKRRMQSQRRRLRVWHEIESTPDFWATLAPIDPAAVPRLQQLTVQYRWEVFFLTQRPETAGDTVQRQTQRWLIHHGFEMPSVLVLKRSRGKIAEALHLDVVIDDSAKNCVDIISESGAKALLVLRHETEQHARPQKARALGIGVVKSIAACMELLEEMELMRSNPTLFEKVAKMVGWKSVGA
ncbi:MAG: hypothetical protein HYX76_09040 [Acidobacteria bacterium]|nr:hypothetical protein [Acidobacteriota bacterium]